MNLYESSMIADIGNLSFLHPANKNLANDIGHLYSFHSADRTDLIPSKTKHLFQLTYFYSADRTCDVGTILMTYLKPPVPTLSGRRQWPERKLCFTPVLFEGCIILSCYEKNGSTSFMMRHFSEVTKRGGCIIFFK